MKVTITPDGTIELDVSNGDGQAALDLIRSLQVADPPPAPLQRHDPAALSPIQRGTLEVLQAHPEGCHYTVVAEFLGLSPSVANTRCQAVTHLGFAERIRAGVYRVVE